MPFKTILFFLFIEKVIISDAGRSPNFPCGGLFNVQTEEKSRDVFNMISDQSTSDTLRGLMIYPSVIDSYSTALEVCKTTTENKGIVALIDARPTNGICDSTCLLCNRLNITQLTVGWEPTESMSNDMYSFSYYPPPEITSKAYATLIKDLDWHKFSILYEDDGSFIRLQEIINSWPHNREPILYRKLDPNGDNRETFKYIFKVERMTYHVLDCHIDNVVTYMKQIVQVDNSTLYQSIILTSLDAHTLNLKDVPNLKANVSTMHLTLANDVRLQDIGIKVDAGIKLETALVADALTHLEKALREVKPTERDNYGDLPALCTMGSKADYEPIAWIYGNDLREALMRTTADGFTGNIQFDEQGKRTNFTLYYSKLDDTNTFGYTGHWESDTDIIVNEDTVAARSIAQKKGVIKVVSKIGKPYFMEGIDANGTKVVRGYALDLINAIFNLINKEKDFALIPEFYAVKGYGNPIEGTKKWDGIVGELMDHKADLGICDLSITSQRNAVIDFSTPFMTTGISMLFKKPEPEAPDMFSFINPLSLDVWLYLATTYILVSFVLLICARMSQDDWVNPHPCNQNPENLENIWSLYNCMWLTMGSIMTQGCDILPRGAGSRWVAGMWWFFALIITASYTANMSTFLSNSRRSNDIKSVKDLADQNKISYGAVLNASTYKFFETSNDTLYTKIWSVMSTAKPTVFTLSNEEGMDRVNRSKGNYAFFMESAAIKYFTERNCNLKMVGQELDSKAYGIAMPKNSPHKSRVDSALLNLQELGTLKQLEIKWWKEEDIVRSCEDDEKEKDDSGSLQMKNTGGIFLVLGVGGILGLIVSVIDFLLHARQISIKEKVTFKEALASEWRASLDPRFLHKPAAPPRSAPPSTGSPSPKLGRSQSRAVSVLRAASSFINFDEIY